jgi:hypothetical protein
LKRHARLVVGALLFGVAALSSASAVPLVAACNSLPEKTCYGARVSASRESALLAEPTCATCLQRECCDEVGACQEDQSCIDTFRQAHFCAMHRLKTESECVSPLGGPDNGRRRLYDCMRTRCGALVAAEAPCQISSCNVNPAVVQLGPATCDRCVNDACCKEVNECYLDRRCKLAVECIVRDCGPTLGQEMTALGDRGPEEVRRERAGVCSSGTIPVDAGRPNAPGCIDKCLNDFAPLAGGTSDDANARCLAFSVFACGASSKCGPKCVAAPIRDASAE